MSRYCLNHGVEQLVQAERFFQKCCSGGQVNGARTCATRICGHKNHWHLCALTANHLDQFSSSPVRHDHICNNEGKTRGIDCELTESAVSIGCRKNRISRVL